MVFKHAPIAIALHELKNEGITLPLMFSRNFFWKVRKKKLKKKVVLGEKKK